MSERGLSQEEQARIHNEQSRLYMDKYAPARPPQPKLSIWLETLVGLAAAWILVAAVLTQDSVNGITLAIVGLAVTTVWCCLYMARR